MDLQIWCLAPLFCDTYDSWIKCIMSCSRYFLVLFENYNTFCSICLFWNYSFFSVIKWFWNIWRSYSSSKTYKGYTIFSEFCFLYMDFWEVCYRSFGGLFTLNIQDTFFSLDESYRPCMRRYLYERK